MAGPFFTKDQSERLAKVKAALVKNTSVGSIFSPSEWQGAKEIPFGSSEWKQKTFRADITQIDCCDVVVAILDYTKYEGETLPDSGTTFEIGYAYAHHKPVICVYDAQISKLNLMLLEAQTSLQTIDDLVDYDFIQLAPQLAVEQQIQVF